MTRKEQNYIPETVAKNNSTGVTESVAMLAEQNTVEASAVKDNSIGVEPLLNTLGSQRITAFESDIDPIEFSLLDSGHFVAYRKVWRDRERRYVSS